MQLVNTESIPGNRIVEVKGLVSGSTIRARNIGRDIGAAIKNITGGELRDYTKLLSDSRSEATQRMVEQAAEMGANAIVSIRYETSAVAAGAAELFAYGTAVVTEAE
jgi:uncharacterized protein YbjQ (UPF0145 family)